MSQNSHTPESLTRKEILRVLNHIANKRRADNQSDGIYMSLLIDQARGGIYDKAGGAYDETLESEWNKKVEIAKSKGKNSFIFEFGGKLYSTETPYLTPPHASEFHWTEPKEIEKL